MFKIHLYFYTPKANYLKIKLNVWKTSSPCSQFCCKPKTALKNNCFTKHIYTHTQLIWGVTSQYKFTFEEESGSHNQGFWKLQQTGKFLKRWVNQITCVLRNLHAGEEETVRIEHRTTD